MRPFVMALEYSTRARQKMNQDHYRKRRDKISVGLGYSCAPDDQVETSFR